MKIILVLLAFSSLFVGKSLTAAECDNLGCYEVIKTFAELIELKISETDSLLVKLSNQSTFGSDEKFMSAIKAVDGRLEKLLDEIMTGVDGGDRSLIGLINAVIDEVTQIENLATEIEHEADNAGKNEKATEATLENIEESIREIERELDRLQNMTTYDGPEALQNAFDRSEKFDTNSNELKDVLGQVKTILKDYEEKLENANNVTSVAMENFAGASNNADKVVEVQKLIDDKLRNAGNLTKIENEFENMKSVAKKAFDEAKAVYDIAFELLNEATALEINDKLSGFNEGIRKLNKHSNDTQVNLQEFSEDNSKLLDELDKTISAAEVLEAKAFDLQDKILEKLEIIENIRKDALAAVGDKDSIVATARNIYNSLDDFALKVEKSRELARIAMEKIPAILKKTQDSVAMVEKLEKKLDDQTKAAEDAKKKCKTAKAQMDEILSESEGIRGNISQLESDFDGLPEAARGNEKESARLSDMIDDLEKIESEDDKLIEATQAKVENIKSQSIEVDLEVDGALKKLQDLEDGIGKLKNIDEESLDKFEVQLMEAEEELEKSELNHNLSILRGQRHDQAELIDRYKLIIAELEYQVAVIKENAESLEKKCFKRTRLEP